MPQLSLMTPLGDITLSEEDGAIVALDWGRGRDQVPTPLLREARDQLHDYFDARRLTFQLPLAPHGTPYQRRVWAALARIPAGETRSYADIAREIASNPDLLIVGQPTRGVDIGAIEYIHKRIIQLRDAGKAVLLVSVELDEIRSLSDRILVMFAGRIMGERGPGATEQDLGLLMAGVAQDAA